MLGFAKRFRATRKTQEWIDELRAGEENPEFKEKTLKYIEIEGIEEVITELEDDCVTQLSESATHVRIDEFSDIDIASVTIRKGEIEIEGSASLGIELQFGSDMDQERGDGVTNSSSVPLEFHLILTPSLEIKEKLSVKVDTSDLGG